MKCLLLLATTLTIITSAIYFLRTPHLPDLDLDEWWGPESLKEKRDDNIRPFIIKFKEQLIQDLKEHIKSTAVFTPPLNPEYGFNSSDIIPWLKYWSEEYDFNERAKFLNQYQSYRTYVQGLNVHFISVRPEVPPGVEIVPLLLLHGWPGSCREFYEAIPLLTSMAEGRDFAVEVIVPSLPGYGYSEGPVRPGLGAAQTAVLFRNLMQKLGFGQYYVQGEDWGAVIGSHMATLFPKEVLGFHSNMATVMTPLSMFLDYLGSFYPSLFMNSQFADHLYPLSESYGYLLKELGFLHLQATKPDTIGVALTDSPAGLLAYIFEKFSNWTDRSQQPLTDRFTKEQLVDNLMFYWATKSITTSMRMYAETFNKKHLGLNLDKIPSQVPTWVLQARYERSHQPPVILKLKYPNLINITTLNEGGHFLALELPKIFAEDVLKAIEEFKKWRKNTRSEF